MFTVRQLRELLACFPDDAPVTMTDRENERCMVEDPYLSFAIPGVVCRE